MLANKGVNLQKVRPPQVKKIAEIETTERIADKSADQ